MKMEESFQENGKNCFRQDFSYEEFFFTYVAPKILPRMVTVDFMVFCNRLIVKAEAHSSHSCVCLKNVDKTSLVNGFFCMIFVAPAFSRMHHRSSHFR